MTVRLPNFVVVGAPKCGTTSLYHYLRAHPEIFLPIQKELHFFSRDHLARNSRGPGDEHVMRSVCRSDDEYAAHYSGAGDARAVGDVSPSYLYYHEVAEAMRAKLGDARIVITLRDPVQKAFSHFMHLVRDNREALSFADALVAEEERTRQGWAVLWRYAGGALYADGVQRYLEVFGRERVHVLCQEELQADPEGSLQALFRFLEVDPSFRPDTEKLHHRSGRPRSRLLADWVSKPGPASSLARILLPPALRHRARAALQNLNTGAKDELGAETAARLRAGFREDTQRLEDLLGRSLPWSEERQP